MSASKGVTISLTFTIIIYSDPTVYMEPYKERLLQPSSSLQYKLEKVREVARNGMVQELFIFPVSSSGGLVIRHGGRKGVFPP